VNPSPDRPHVLHWGSAGLRDHDAPTAPWVWQGYLAPGGTTLLSGRWASGKTTLAAVLLARLRSGGRLAGLPVAAGRAIVVSTEARWHWQRRDDRLHFSDHIGWSFAPFRGDRPTPERWQAFAEGLAAEHARCPYALLVLDPVEDFLAGSGNDAAAVCHFLTPLQCLSARGVAVWMLYEPELERPAGAGPQRGAALRDAADIVMDLSTYPGAAGDDRRRCLLASSRFPETPGQLVIAWTADGTDYESLGPCVPEAFGGAWPVLRGLLAAAPRALTRAEIHRGWPGERPVDRCTLRRWLAQAAARGLLVKAGAGTRRLPFRYGLAERAAS
jgi:AAA domain